MDSKKSAMRNVTPNLCFASGGICGSRNVLRCVQHVKQRRTIFHARVSVRIPQKVRWDMLHQTCVFASGTDSRKSTMGHVTPNLHFCIRWDLQVM
jgi:hypothetical protein